MVQDLRIAARTLLKTPSFALTVVAVLAFGIGANTSVFSAVNQLLLHPPGIHQPEQVVAVRVKYENMSMPSISASVPDFADVQKSKQVFEHVALLNEMDCNFNAGGAPERLHCAEVTEEWFAVFGANPSLGRIFHSEEDQPNANLSVVLSDSTWKRLFGASNTVLGQTLELNRKRFQVVGVMKPDFRWPRQVDVWIPMGLDQRAYKEDNRFNENFFAVARLQHAISIEQANAVMGVLVNRVRAGSVNGAYAKASGWGMFVMPLADFVAGDNKRPVLILLIAVGFILLIASSNIAGLVLARTSGRAREIAIRAAMGAGRWQILMHSLAESAWLTTLGALLGLVLAAAALRLLMNYAPEESVFGLTTRLDWRVLVFTGTITTISGILFTLGSVWGVTRINAHEILKSTGRSGMSDRGRRRVRSTLVIGETALALILLAGAGLFLRSLSNLGTVRTGFDASGVVTAMLSLPVTAYPKDENRIEFFRAVTERLQNSPGVNAAAAVVPLPFSGMDSSASFAIEGRPAGPGDPGPHGNITYATAGYAAAMGIPVKQGRFFTTADGKDAPGVAVIDENLARQYWPNENPIGKRITNGDGKKGPWSTIVGVAGHVKSNNLAFDSGKGMYYYPMSQQVAPFAALVVKAPPRLSGVVALIRRAVKETDAGQPAHTVKTMEELVAGSLSGRRFVVDLLALFSVAALLMAALGLYGVIGYSVMQRTQEIGIRMALGAQRGSVLRQVVREGMLLSGWGVGIGLLGALSAGRLMQSQLFDVSPFDPPTFLASSAVLVATSLLACYLPARRATRVDPMVALRND